MTKYKLLLAGLVCLIAFNACDEDKLALVNPNALSPETFLQTPAQVQSAVNAIYANLQTRGLYVRHMFFMMDNMGHENEGNSQLEADKRDYLEFDFDASHGAIGAYWESCYRGINKANYYIGNQEKINEIDDAVLPQAVKDMHLGEAKFLRGLYYFLLVTRFGDIPLITDIPVGGEGVAKSAASEIYTQIVTDLTDATTLLPSKSDGAYQPGRATSGAAWAMLGKTQLFQENWAAALAAFGNVTGYSLGSFEDNFLEETEHGVESIFEVEFDLTLGYSQVWDSDRSGAGLQEATFRAQEYGWNNWNNVFPSVDLRNEFEPGDERFALSFYVNGDLYNNGLSVVALPATGQTAGWRKYQNYYKQPSETNNVSGINFKVIRYADVLLMMAEAENEITPGSATAIGYIDQVRNRAGLANYAGAATGPAVFDAIVHERRCELAGEQTRFPDLVRWGLAASTLPNFVAGKSEVFPIPQAEIDANSALTSADQNSGY
ncbi:MAG: RagB/SusD family nutrient uptake outer membrane protein [Reichenbachiella sp.]